MASALIHVVVAKKVNEVLKLDEKPFILGSIAPDMAKLVGINRDLTHFILDEESSTPNIEYFLSKYRNELNKPFEIGCFVHLLTDVLWFDEFKKNFVLNDSIITKSGERIFINDDSEIGRMIYDDYTSLNSELIDYYNLDYSLFYEKMEYPESHIEEIDSKYFDALINKMGLICSNIKNYNYLFDLTKITHFIEFATVYCLDELKKYGVLK